jgi:Leucine-rich repeat (LRR) protein
VLAERSAYPNTGGFLYVEEGGTAAAEACVGELAAGLGERFRLDTFLRSILDALQVEGAVAPVPRLSSTGADLDCSGAPSDERKEAEDSGAGTDEDTNTEADEDDEDSDDEDNEDGDEYMYDDASEQHLAACEEQRRVATDAGASFSGWWCMLDCPFALLDARGSLRLVTDAVHEDDALCLALTCRALRDALWARFPARPPGHAHAGKRLRTWDAAVARLGARVDASGMLELFLSDLRALPEVVGRLAYLPHPRLRVLRLHSSEAALPAGLWSLAGLEELDLRYCGLTALPEEIGRLAGLKKLNLSENRELTVLPAGLCALAGLEELNLVDCGLRALPGGIGRLTGLKKLNLRYNPRLAALPAGLCSLAGLEELELPGCGLTALPEGIGGLAGLKKLNLDRNGGLTALPEGLCALAGLEELNLNSCGLRALPEGMEGLAGLKRLRLWKNEKLTALPAGLGRLRNLEELDLFLCPGLPGLHDLQGRQDLPALLAHLAAQGGKPAVRIL